MMKIAGDADRLAEAEMQVRQQVALLGDEVVQLAKLTYAIRRELVTLGSSIDSAQPSSGNPNLDPDLVRAIRVKVDELLDLAGALRQGFTREATRCEAALRELDDVRRSIGGRR